MSNHQPRKYRQNISPIREGIAIYKEITKIKPFVNFSSTPVSTKLQRKKTANKRELQYKRAGSKNLLQAAHSLLNLLEQTLINQSYAILLTDDEGYIIEFRSDAETKCAYENNEFDLGILNYCNDAKNVNDPWLNSSQGPVIVGDVDQYTININGWTCCGVPIRDVEDKFIGLLEVAVPNDTIPPHTLAILLCACQTIEQELAEIKDINNKVLKEQKLEKLILNKLPQIIFALDEKLNILYLNQFGFERIFPDEAVKEDIIGRSLFEVLPIGQECKKWFDDILLGQSGSGERNISILVQKKMLDLSIQASKLINDKGKLIGVLLVINC
ncbi:PAS domain-containing protein [Desulfolucanica intricata]|uniref:PAS domain-containing protein n=1 Tax=Desulfolucanica intricata TaxID=1285191 RepID=UPI0008362812|nr:PAS domain-containing protein [Desulfolucanica intricata]